MNLRTRLVAAILAAVLISGISPVWAADISSSDWSETDGSNNSAPPNGWKAGMAPNQVEPTARAMMGATKRFYNHINGTQTSGGTANAQTLTYDVAPTAYVTGDVYTFKIGTSNTGATTLDVNSLGATAVQLSGAALAGGELTAGNYVSVVYDGTNFQLLSTALNAFTGDSGSGGTVGLVPAPAAGDAAANKFLKASGAWSAIPNATTQVLTSGSAATYNTPAGCRQLQIWGKAGGGGGGGSGTSGATDGGAGGTTTFNAISAAGGGDGAGSGSNGVGGSGGTGGAGSATWRTPGAPGVGSMSRTTGVAGGSGGGKGGAAGTATSGTSGVANSGGGGSGGTAAGGGTVNGGGGGGEGEEFFLIINSPAASYTYTVGAGGTAGSAGTSGSNGGAGGSGVIRVMEIY